MAQKSLDSFFNKANNDKKRKASSDEEDEQEEVISAKKGKAPAKKAAPKSSKKSKVDEESLENGADGAAEDETKKALVTVSSSSSKKGLPKAAQQIANHLTEESWKTILDPEFSKAYFSSLATFLEAERADTKNKIYPPGNLVFNALNACSFDNVRVVILGQDPYFNEGQAMGLSFSVLPGTTPPPSLKNMYKELKEDPDVKFDIPKHGDLTKWAQQGVLLLNTVLTVRGGLANSHQKKGWEAFTDIIIDAVNTRSKHGVVFMLWGLPSQKKASKINPSKHCILKAAHPSPLSASKGFFWMQTFLKS